MKTLIAFLVILLSCKENENRVTKNDVTKPRDYKFKGAGLDFTLSKNNKNTDPNQLLREIKLKRKEFEDKTRNFQVKYSNSRYSLSEITAISKRYNDFINDKANVEYLPMFRKKYATLVLNNYGLNESDDFESVNFFTKELINSENADYDIILNSLKILKNNIPDTEFNSTKLLASSYLEKQINKENLFKSHYEKKIVELKDAPNTNNQGTLRNEFLISLMKKKSQEIEDKKTSTYLDKLSKI